MDHGYEPVIAELKHVRKTYGSGDTTVVALDNIDMVVRQGEYVAVMGTSGSGKSTVMNIMGCLDRPSSGSYRLNDTAVEQLTDDQIADKRRRELGFVYPQIHLLQEKRALDNVVLPMVYAQIDRDEREERGIQALNRVGLGKRLLNKPNQLSGGQQQRVAIARAIINNPKLLLADEPTGALDSNTTNEVLDIFDELNCSGSTVILVTHEQEVADRASRLVLVQDGKISKKT